LEARFQPCQEFEIQKQVQDDRFCHAEQALASLKWQVLERDPETSSG